MVDKGGGSETARERRDSLRLVGELAEGGIHVAPHVIARLQQRLDDDPQAVLETAKTLDPEVRSGMRFLPDPLPVVDSISTRYRGLALSAAESDALLIASLVPGRRVDILAEVCGLSQERLRSGALGVWLDIAAGRFTFVERRLRVWIRGCASPGDRVEAHRRLAVWHEERQDRARAAWHGARSASRQRPDLAPTLLVEARRMLRRGQAYSAYRVAVEAFHHAAAADRDRARTLAGTAALGAGCLEDATGWLRDLFPSGAETQRLTALAPLIVAETHLTGALPLQDADGHRPRRPAPADRSAWAAASAMAAVASAERGRGTATRGWLAEVRSAGGNTGGGMVREAAAAFCLLLSGEEAEQDEPPPDTLSGAIVAALRLGVHDDAPAGLAVLARQRNALSAASDPLLRGLDSTPLARAYRAVTEVLLRIWNGDISEADRRLASASMRYPVVLPFAGLAVGLARWLDTAVRGAPGALTCGLATVQPRGDRADVQVGLAVQAYLAGSVETASAHLQLWHDRGAPHLPLRPPGLDEVGPFDDTRAVVPGEELMARALMHRIRSVASSSWQREYREVEEQTRQIRSPFTRARAEALLGTTCVIRGDHAAGRRHMRVSRALFADVGADAWRHSMDVRLAKLGEQVEAFARVDTMPIAVTSLDPLADCRAAWTPVLTDRELQVAMLVVDGAANRDVAERLDVSVRTVEVHLGRIFGKLEVRTRLELTVLAHRTNQYI